MGGTVYQSTRPVRKSTIRFLLWQDLSGGQREGHEVQGCAAGREAGPPIGIESPVFLLLWPMACLSEGPDTGIHIREIRHISVQAHPAQAWKLLSVRIDRQRDRPVLRRIAGGRTVRKDGARHSGDAPRYSEICRCGISGRISGSQHPLSEGTPERNAGAFSVRTDILYRLPCKGDGPL